MRWCRQPDPGRRVSRGYLVSLEGMGGLLPDVNGGPIVFEAGDRGPARRLPLLDLHRERPRRHAGAAADRPQRERRHDDQRWRCRSPARPRPRRGVAQALTGTGRRYPDRRRRHRADAERAADGVRADRSPSAARRAHRVVLPRTAGAAGRARRRAPRTTRSRRGERVRPADRAVRRLVRRGLAARPAARAAERRHGEPALPVEAADPAAPGPRPEESRLQGGRRLFPSLLAARATALDRRAPRLPAEVATWFGQLASLAGVPFNYLVPDERMLPPESLRLVYLDDNWLDALIDGAFSVGRAAVGPDSLESAADVHHPPGRPRAVRPRRGQPAVGRRGTTWHRSTRRLRSRVSCSARRRSPGWPNLRMVGFSDAAATMQLPALRIAQLSNDTVLCLFRGERRGRLPARAARAAAPRRRRRRRSDALLDHAAFSLGRTRCDSGRERSTTRRETEPIPMRGDYRTSR